MSVVLTLLSADGRKERVQVYEDSPSPVEAIKRAEREHPMFTVVTMKYNHVQEKQNDGKPNPQ